MERIDRIALKIIILAALIITFTLVKFTTPNQSKQIIILRDSLANETKDKLYYRTQYLKANTQLIELKNRIISNEIIIN